MPEGNKPFVVNDRRKFTLDGEPRPDREIGREEPDQATASVSTAVVSPEAVNPPALQIPPMSSDDVFAAEKDATESDSPTAEQIEQSRIAYQATAERLDTAIRAANPGGDHPPPMNFEQLVQSVYMTAIMQLGGGAADEQQPRLDLLGARQSIDMLGVLAEKTSGNLSQGEMRLVHGALFDARLAFLEVAQALARSAASKSQAPARPAIVR